MFGNMSGLKMNTNKTKVIWIGRKKYSKDKLDVSVNLDWGTTEFTLLGIYYNVDLNIMIQTSFSKALQKAKEKLINRKKRILTPLGKITVIKTYLFSQFNHLFMSIPMPPESFIKEFNKMLFNYVWDGKPDKIKIIQITKDYLEGGLKMINTENFIKSIKLTWIRRLFQSYTSDWVNLFETTICNVRDFFLKYSIINSENSNTEISNRFWNEIIRTWSNFSVNTPISSNQDIMYTPLWNNKRIFKSGTCLNRWLNKGITYVGDLIKDDGSILSLEEIELKFNLKVNFLEYFQIRMSTRNCFSQKNVSDPLLLNYFY